MPIQDFGLLFSQLHDYLIISWAAPLPADRDQILCRHLILPDVYLQIFPILFLYSNSVLVSGCRRQKREDSHPALADGRCLVSINEL